MGQPLRDGGDTEHPVLPVELEIGKMRQQPGGHRCHGSGPILHHGFTPGNGRRVGSQV
ncbi:MAG: hypothetical protein OZSIB_1202 [Candidatus Ozemobacter sibiricus]|uniref:Uncharacterized protein n=1 Tax=Candidatus Ozemobacter sibiricus TaxID=2268124 RepID=A0A367ZKP6_9BACT|nr:MAG: hypothetical protein OZSIB_1202 [Candidatus Ozemobacter sibiricus]